MAEHHHAGRLRRGARALRRAPRRLLGGAGGALRWLPALAGLAGAATLILAEQTTIHSVRVLTVTLAHVSGGQRHHHLLLAGGIAAAVLVALAVLRRSRLPGLGLLALGAGAALLALAGDLPSAHDAGRFGLLFEGARGQAGPALTLELVAAGLLAIAGAGILARGGRPAR